MKKQVAFSRFFPLVYLSQLISYSIKVKIFFLFLFPLSFFSVLSLHATVHQSQNLLISKHLNMASVPDTSPSGNILMAKSLGLGGGGVIEGSGGFFTHVFKTWENALSKPLKPEHENEELKIKTQKENSIIRMTPNIFSPLFPFLFSSPVTKTIKWEMKMTCFFLTLT